MGVLLSPAPGAAFVCLRWVPEGETIDVQATLQQAPRWSAALHEEIDGAGLHDGIQAAIAPGLAEALAEAVLDEVTEQDLRDVDTAVVAAFRGWESGVLGFDVTLDGPAVRGLSDGAEVDVFAVPDTDPVFTGNNFFGVTFTRSRFVAERELSNGTVLPGDAFTRTDIFLNIDQLAGLARFLTREQKLAALQRLMMHELGHALGLHHPNIFRFANLDDDTDPRNRIPVQPADPFADLFVSMVIDQDAVMSNRPRPEGAVFTTLRNDDLSGRDVLYPDPAGPVLSSTPTPTRTATRPPSPTTTPTPAPSPTTTAIPCPGDCNDDGIVAIDELIRAVRIALGDDDRGRCRAIDADDDGVVMIHELVAAVTRALKGC